LLRSLQEACLIRLDAKATISPEQNSLLFAPAGAVVIEILNQTGADVILASL
jgi:hypothetical protein